MDIDNIFKNTQPAPELASERLETMIDRASSYPQLKKPANQNTPFIRKALAAAAVVLLMIGAGIELCPSPKHVINVDSEDAYGEVTDLMFLETLNDLT